MKKRLLRLLAVCGFVLLSGVAFGQVPIISYPGTPFTVNTGAAITPITPTSTGGAVGTYPALVNFATTNGKANGIAYDPVKTTFYAIDYPNGYVDKINPTNGNVSIWDQYPIPGMDVYGLAIDGSGNIYSNSSTNNVVYEFSPTTQTNTTGTAGIIRTITGINSPNGITIDLSNNAYVADANTGTIYKIPSGTANSKTAFLTGFTAPYGVAFDAAGDLFVSQGGTANNIIEVVNALGGGTAKTVFATGFNAPANLTFDPYGNLFVTDAGSIKAVTPSGVVTAVFTSANTPNQVDFDPTGNLYLADYTKNIKKSTVNLTTGFYTYTGTLPAGLSLNAQTGVISGTPTTATAPGGATIVVTAHNNNGNSATTSVTIVVNAPVAPQLTYAATTITYGAGVSITPNYNSKPTPTTCTITPAVAGFTVSAAGIVTSTVNPAAGSYTLTIVNKNGTLSGPNATVSITVNKAPLTITPTNTSRPYGPNLTTYPATYTTLVNGDTQTSAFTTQPTFSTTATATSPVSGLTYPITASGAASNNYTITYGAPATLTITKAPLTILANNVNKNYGATLTNTIGSTAFTTTGMQNGETATVSIAYGAAAAANANVGTYAGQVTPSGALPALGSTFLASNYTITYSSGSIIVNPIPLTITANPASKTYGATLNNVTGSTAFTTTGLIAGDNVGTVTIKYGAAAAATAIAGTYTGQVTPSLATGPDAGNYTITYVSGTLTVNKANLTVKADDISRDYGINVAYTITYSGFVNGDGTGDLATLATASSVATTASLVSPPTYAIVPSGGSDNNYNYVYVNGTLTITSPGTHVYIWDWAGNVSTAWETPQNWYINGVQQTGSYPGLLTNKDKVQEEVNITFATNKSPVVNATPPFAINTLLFGSSNNANITVNSGVVLTTTGDITIQADNTVFGANLTGGLAGNGTINTVNINITNNQTLFSGETTTIASSVSILNVSGNISLTTSSGALAAPVSRFSLTAGTATVNGVLKSNNNPGFFASATSAYAVSNATLILTNTAAMSGLDNQGTNTFSFNNTGSTVQYSGAAQTIYTDANINGATAGPQYRNLIIAGTGAKTLSTSGSLDIAGDYTNSLANDASNYITLTNPNNSVTFNGNGFDQTLNGGVGTGTIFNNVNVTGGTSTKTMATGTFTVISAGTLNMTGTSTTCVLNANGRLTLNSDANSTATVSAFTGSKITGNVNVQRYVTGGSSYRGYRAFSSPVNTGGVINQTTTIAYIDPTYLNSGMLTGGPGTGFTNTTQNPLSYLYDDSRPSSSYKFYSGKNVGIYSIAGATAYTVTVYNTDGSVVTTPRQVPVGNSIMTYYAGTSVLSNPSPESTVVTATGTLNQGTINVYLYKPNATASQYLITTGVGSPVLNLNQVGNPYASTIQLTAFYNDNSTHIQQTVYMMDPTTGASGTYLAYNASNGTTQSTNRASNYIVSGQGFWVMSKGTNPTLLFKETEKVAYPAISSTTTSSGSPSTGGTLLMDVPGTASNTDIKAGSFAQNITAPAPDTTASVAFAQKVKALIGLHLQLSKDSDKSATNTQTGIYFSQQWSDAYNVDEDAIDRDGATPKVFLSSYSSDTKRLAINQLADYSKGKKIKLYTNATASGQYYISLADIANVDTINYNVFLVDHKMNDSLDMVKYKSYAFNINTADTTTFGANRFTLAIERHALPPYSLITFAGQKVNRGIQLNWKTLNEGNYTGFALQKLGGSNTYASIYLKQGTGVGTYGYLDAQPVNGNNTYRLQQTDIDGRVTYSMPVTINYKSNLQNGALSVYPNPAKSIINVSLNTNGPGSSKYIVDIYNTSGTVIDHKIVNSNNWTQDVSNYKLGVYVIEIKTSDGYLIGNTKFVKIIN